MNQSMLADPVRLRLLALAEERRASLSALSRMIGKNASYLQQFVRKGSPRRLEENDRAALARFFGVPETELGASKEISYIAASSGEGRGRWVDLPRLPLGASAGPGALADGAEHGFDTLRFSRDWLRAQGLDPAALSAIAVSGDSMEPTLRDGDEILVDTRPRPLRDGICVVRLDGTVLVKRVAGRGGDRVALISDNPAYRPIESTLEACTVIGRVVWKGGRV